MGKQQNYYSRQGEHLSIYHSVSTMRADPTTTEKERVSTYSYYVAIAYAYGSPANCPEQITTSRATNHRISLNKSVFRTVLFYHYERSCAHARRSAI